MIWAIYQKEQALIQSSLEEKDRLPSGKIHHIIFQRLVSDKTDFVHDQEHTNKINEWKKTNTSL